MLPLDCKYFCSAGTCVALCPSHKQQEMRVRSCLGFRKEILLQNFRGIKIKQVFKIRVMYAAAALLQLWNEKGERPEDERSEHFGLFLVCLECFC